MTSNTRQGSALTEAQRDLLRSAVREGYFKVPREISLVELADIHDVSDREASQQLRRGLDAVLQDVTISD
ncbi:MAG: helix-turn-helix domain-containing protein [Halapricum sp.]